MVGSVAGRVHGEDTGTAADIEDNLVLEEVGILVDRVAVASCANLVFLNLAVSNYFLSYVGCNPGQAYQHFLVDAFTRALVLLCVCRARRRTMVVVAVHSILAIASSYASLVSSIPVEVMRLSVGQGGDAFLTGGRRSVVCHSRVLEIRISEKVR